MRKVFVYIVVAAVFAVSCESVKTDSPVQYGKLSISLAQEPVLDVKSNVALTPEQAADYNVAVYADQACSGSPVIAPMEYSAFGTQTIAVGEYYVEAESCTEADAEACEAYPNGQKRLYGVSGKVSVSTETPVTAIVNCMVSNALVTVSFDQETIYDDDQCRFTDLKVSLSSGSKSTEIPASKTDVEHWFNPCELTYSITGQFTATGKYISVEKTLNLDAKSNVRLLVKANLDNGQLAPSVTFAKDITEADDIASGFNPYK